VRVAWIICALSLALAMIDLVLVALNSSHLDVHIPEPWIGDNPKGSIFEDWLKSKDRGEDEKNSSPS
jgi:hypothetical protein